jgi:hypothetical protein
LLDVYKPTRFTNEFLRRERVAVLQQLVTHGKEVDSRRKQFRGCAFTFASRTAGPDKIPLSFHRDVENAAKSFAAWRMDFGV